MLKRTIIGGMTLVKFRVKVGFTLWLKTKETLAPDQMLIW
jgi:hypothetical protein